MALTHSHLTALAKRDTLKVVGILTMLTEGERNALLHASTELTTIWEAR